MEILVLLFAFISMILVLKSIPEQIPTHNPFKTPLYSVTLYIPYEAIENNPSIINRIHNALKEKHPKAAIFVFPTHKKDPFVRLQTIDLDYLTREELKRVEKKADKVIEELIKTYSNPTS